MSYGVTYTIGAVTYNLSGYDPITEMDMQYVGALNLGGAPLHAITSRGALQHGDTQLDFRLDPRIITLAWAVHTSSLSELTQILDKFHQIFTPSNILGTLKITRDDGTVRAIDCYYIGGLEDNIQPDSYNLKLPVQLRCPDPTWYDPVQQYVSIINGVDGTATAYPYTLPVTYGSGSSLIVQIPYTGTWISYPIIEVTGPITSLIIRNQSTNDVLRLNAAIPAGSTYRFDLRYGYKTVTDQNGTNQISKLTSSSDIATFSLVHSPIATGGINSISVSGTGATAATIIDLFYYTRYHGI